MKYLFDWKNEINEDELKIVINQLKNDELVLVPTETVYGLGGDAMNPSASQKIYAAKGRPSDNPLIVHIWDYSQLEEIAAELPPEAKKLSDAFWPGPMTLIVPKNDKIPYETTGGLDTVAVRMPSHEVAREFIRRVNRSTDRYGATYSSITIPEQYPQIFSWLDLLDMNVIVIIILMLCVSGFSIISGLVILILDAVQFVGVMKALGSDNRFLRTIFISQASMLVLRGMFWGNVLGLGLCALQYFTHIIPLDAATYYVDAVPVVFPWLWLLALNVLVFAVSFLIMLLPSLIVSRISPARVMHFE